MEAPRRPLDPGLDEFAGQIGAELERNEHGWPGRTLRWSREGLNRQIEICLLEEATLLFGVSACAWRDEGGRRYWRSERVAEGLDAADLETRLESPLREAQRIVTSWTDEDLEFAGYIAGSPEFERRQRRNRVVFYMLVSGLLALAAGILWWVAT